MQNPNIIFVFNEITHDNIILKNVYMIECLCDFGTVWHGDRESVYASCYFVLMMNIRIFIYHMICVLINIILSAPAQHYSSSHATYYVHTWTCINE